MRILDLPCWTAVTAGNDLHTSGRFLFQGQNTKAADRSGNFSLICKKRFHCYMVYLVFLRPGVTRSTETNWAAQL
eukprot:1137820-Pelagomonas_calceolata.AAC.4